MIDTIDMEVVQGLIVRPDKKVLAEYRPGNKKKPNMWAYPGGKLDPEDNGSRHLALHRELKEELGIDAVIGRLINVELFKWKENVHIYLYAVTAWSGEPKALVAEKIDWIDPEYAIDYMPCMPGMFAAYRDVMRFLKKLP